MKLVEEYEEDYGDIPFDFDERISYIESKIKSTKVFGVIVSC